MKQEYKQELVLQFPANSMRDYDAMIEMENCIIAGLGGYGEVDGHDMGMGEMNIFVRTDNPKLTFEKIKALIGPELYFDTRAAFRNIGGNDFTILYPANLSNFKIA